MAAAQALLAGVPEAAAALDADGRVLVANPAWGGVVACPPGDSYLAWLAAGRADAAPRAPALAAAVAVLAGGRPDAAFEHAAGPRRFDVRLTRLPAGLGPVRALAVHQDITERRRLEAELAEAAALSDSVFESSPDCVKVLAVDGRLLAMNEAGWQMMEFPDRTAVVGTAWVDFWPVEARPMARAAIDGASRGGIERFQGQAPTASGRPRWWDNVVAPVRDAAGRTTRLVCISRDITDLKQQEAALREEKDRYAALLGAQSDLGVGLAVLEGERIVEANDALATITGYTVAELLALPSFTRLLPASEWAKAFAQLRRGPAGERRPASVEYSFLHRTAGPRRAEAAVMPFVSAGREQSLAVVRDVTERHEAASRIAFQASLLDQVRNAVVAMDRESRVVYWNRWAEVLHGWTAAEAVGQPIASLIGLTEAPAQTRRVDEAVRETGAFDGELALRRKDGRPITIQLTTVALRDAEGGRIGTVGVASDITERQAIEARLRLLESAVLNARDAVVMTEARPIDPPGPRISFVNDAFVATTGYTAAEIIGQHPRLLQGPATDRAELDRIRRALETERPVRAELLNYRQDGRPFWVELQIAPVYDQAGVCTHYVSIQRDVTERNERETALRASEAEARRLGLIVARMTSGIVITDAEFRVVWVNQAVADYLGVAPASLLGRPATALLAGTGIEPATLDRLHHSVARREGFTLDLPFEAATGATSWIHTDTQPLRDAAGEMTGFISIVTDDTERHGLEEQLRQAQKMEAIGRLAGGIAHDFNNVLGVILGYTELLLDQLPAGDARRQWLEQIQQGGERAAALTRQLLAFSRKQVLQPTLLDLNQVVEAFVPMVHRLIGEDIRLDRRLAPGLAPVRVDRGQIEQVLLNLIVNARDAMPRGGTLTISTAPAALDAPSPGQPAPQAVAVTVRDTGVGMAAATLARAFEPFFTTKGPGEGTGLGLATAYGIVKQHGGDIRVTSAEGEGSAFEVLLPCAPEPAGA